MPSFCLPYRQHMGVLTLAMQGMSALGKRAYQFIYCTTRGSCLKAAATLLKALK